MPPKPFLRVALVVASLLAIGVGGPGFAQISTRQTDDSPSKSTTEQAGVTQDAEPSATEMSEQEKIAEALANPLSYLWLLFMQNDVISYDGDILDTLGEDAQTQNIMLLQPVLSVQALLMAPRSRPTTTRARPTRRHRPPR